MGAVNRRCVFVKDEEARDTDPILFGVSSVSVAQLTVNQSGRVRFP